MEFLAPIYGAGVVIFYAHGRFNEASYETRVGLERLNSLLSVNSMRTASIVRLSFVYYVGALLTIYLLVSAYVLLFSISIEIEPDPNTVGGVASGAVRNSIGNYGTVFLSVALAVVGLAQNVPYLRNIEGWLRRSAHGLAGIPTRVLAQTRELLEEPFLVDAELLSSEDRDLLEKLNRRRDEALLRDVSLIAAVGAWVLNSRSLVSESRLHDTFGKLEESLRARKRTLFQRLKDEVGLSGGVAQRVPGLEDPHVITVASEADELADDMCVLLALYREHGLLKPAIDSGSANPARYSRNQRRHKQLNDFISENNSAAQSEQRNAQQAMLAISWAFGVVVILGLAWSAVPGLWEQQITFWGDPKANIGWGQRLFERLTDGLFSIFLPTAIGIGIWQGMKASGDWGKGLCDHWTKALYRALLVFACGWAVGTFFICGAALWSAGLENGWNASAVKLKDTLIGTFSFNAPYVIRGAVLAMLVVGCLDRWQQAMPSLLDIWWTSLMAAFLLGLIGGTVRLQGVLASNLSEAIWPSEYRAGVVFYAITYAALIGFCLLFALTSALRNIMKDDPAQGKRPVDPSRYRRRLIRFPLHELRTGLHKYSRLPRLRLRSQLGKKRRDAANRSSISAIIIATTLLCAMPAGSVAQQITIGVRDDARPYVWVQRDAAGKVQANGYFWEVCALLVANAGLIFTFEPVNLDVRRQFMAGQHKEIDLLCDPTTLTLRRLTEFIDNRPPGPKVATHLRLLPIFHLANRGYLVRTPPPDNRRASWWTKCKDSWSKCVRLWPEEANNDETVRIAVQGTTGADSLKAVSQVPLPDCGNPPDPILQSCIASSHEHTAEVLCTARKPAEYHGDIELIRAAVERWNIANSGRGKCEVKAILSERPIRIAVQGTTSADSLNMERQAPLPDCGNPPDPILQSCMASSHEHAAEVFCTAKKPVEYHGDIELIRAAVERWNDRRSSRNECVFKEGSEAQANPSDAPANPDQEAAPANPNQDTYEPYALLISNHNVSDLDLRLTMELYRLARNGRLRSMLESHFPEARISMDLDSLLRILSIPPGAHPWTGGQPSTQAASAITASDNVAE